MTRGPNPHLFFAIFSHDPSLCSLRFLYCSDLPKGYLGFSTTLGASDDLVMPKAPSCPLGTDCTDCGLTVSFQQCLLIGGCAACCAAL